MASKDDLDLKAELKDALAGLTPPTEREEISAGFFHRTLARWLGLPEGKQPGRKKQAPPLWSYDLWKAELVDDGDGHYTARLFKNPDRSPEIVRYWIALDGSGRIKKSGWHTSAPNLVDELSAFVSKPIEPRAIAELYSSDD